MHINYLSFKPAVRDDALEQRSLHLAVEECVPDAVVIVVRREEERQGEGADNLEGGPAWI